MDTASVGSTTGGNEFGFACIQYAYDGAIGGAGRDYLLMALKPCFSF